MTPPSLPDADPTRGRAVGPILELVGLVAVLGAMVLKGTIAVSTFPGWDFDPFTFPSPSAGIGPAGAMWCDVVAVLGATAAIAGRSLAGIALRVLPALLAAFGLAGVALHSWPPVRHTIGDMWIGSGWGAAVLAGLVVAETTAGARGRRARAIVSGVVIGFVALLALRAVQQVFIEHPATVAEFRRNKAQVFAAQGWTPDSPMARAYERRILQAEATGWFGLANVLATFGAAGTVAGVGLLMAAWKDRRASSPLLLAGATGTAAAGAATVALAGGKGGYVATALGLAVLGIFGVLRVRPRPRLGGAVALGALGATLALVAAGSMTQQLSLLFRWFYMQASVRIGAQHLPAGVGPDGFQAAYVLAKNPLSPEDVTSSHNVLLDWFATLGVFGIAWAVLWCTWVWRAGVRGCVTPGTPPPLDDTGGKLERWCVAGVGTLATVAGVRIDQDVMTPDVALTRLAGLVAFVLAGWTALSLARRGDAWVRRGLAAGAIAAAAHSLIDVTAVWPSSAGMLMVIVALGGSGVEVVRRRLPLVVLPGVLVTALGLAVVAPVFRVAVWEGALRSSAAGAAEIGTLAQRWSDVNEALRLRRPGALESARELAAEFAQRRRGAPPSSPEEFEHALRRADEDVTRFTAEFLEDKLLGVLPLEWRVRREASRLWLRAAALREQRGDAAGAEEARAHAVRVAEALPPGETPASSLAWLSLALEARADGPEERAWLTRSAEALERASERSPYELEYAVRLMGLWERAGNAEKTRRWAARALELDQGVKYDREVKGMTPEARAKATRLSGGS
jgi:hypothetical protein